MSPGNVWQWVPCGIAVQSHIISLNYGTRTLLEWYFRLIWKVKPIHTSSETIQRVQLYTVNVGINSNRRLWENHPTLKIYLQRTLILKLAFAACPTPFQAMHLYLPCCCREMLTIVNLFPWYKTAGFPSFLQVMFGVGPPVALQWNITLLFSTTVWLEGARLIWEESENKATSVTSEYHAMDGVILTKPCWAINNKL